MSMNVYKGLDLVVKRDYELGRRLFLYLKNLEEVVRPFSPTPLLCLLSL